MIGFFRGQPTEHVMQYVSGKIRREGAGIAFYYLTHNTNIVAVPTSSADADFVFNEITSNFQEVTLQGQFTWRIADPGQAAALLNYTIDPRTHIYVSSEPERMLQRISNAIRMETRDEIRKRSLEDVLNDTAVMAVTVLARIRDQALLQTMGAELLNLYFLSARPAPDVGKALEADYREALLRRADEATYARRAAAVEQERKIKENELNTDIALEQQREQLIGLEGANVERQAEHRGRALAVEAEFRARAMEMEATAYEAVDPAKIFAFAIRELAARLEQVVAANRASSPYDLEEPGA